MEKERIIKTKTKLNDIADTIYKGDLIRGMAEMVDIIPTLGEVARELNGEKQTNFVDEALRPALEAMEEKDGTMLADIISYEIVPILEEL